MNLQEAIDNIRARRDVCEEASKDSTLDSMSRGLYESRVIGYDYCLNTLELVDEVGA